MHVLLALSMTLVAHAGLGPRPPARCDAALARPTGAAPVDVDRTYERLIAAAVGVARGEAVARADLDLIEGVRAAYARLFARALDFSAIAAKVLSSGQTHDQQLLRAVAEFGRVTSARPSAQSPTPPNQSLRDVQRAYLRARTSSRSEDLALVRGVDRAFAELHGEVPGPGRLFLSEKDDQALMAAVGRYVSRDRPRPSCFTGRMRVATPSGERAIASLAVGDAVYSYDHAARRIVISRVVGVRRTPDVAFGILTGHARPIEVTGEHRFYAGARYEPIATIPERRALFGLNDAKLREPACVDLIERPRGVYAPAGRETVVEISLGAGPHNYFVEGILVHNVKEIGL